jgi:hypothetical protein
MLSLREVSKVPSHEPVKVSVDSLLEWLESLSARPIVHQLPEVHNALLTAILDIRDMRMRDAADQSKVDELFREIVDAIERRRRIN